MTALAEALVAAQRSAVSALAKQYVNGTVEREAADEWLEAFGLTDRVDAAQWFSCLDAIAQFGTGVPAEPRTAAQNGSDKATDAQLALVAKLVKEKGVTAPDLPLSKAQAHDVIDALKAGTYDAAQWVVPF